MDRTEKGQVLFDIIYYAVLGAAIFFVFRYVCLWLLPFLLGAGIAAMLRPTVLRLLRRTRMSEKAAFMFVLFCFYLAATAAVGIFLTIVLAQFYELLLQLPDIYSQGIAPVLERFSGWFYGMLGRFTPDTGASLESLSQAVSEAVKQAAVDGSTHLMGWLAGFFSRLPVLLIATVFTVVISILTACNYAMVAKFLRGLIPERLAPRVCGLQRFVRETLWQYLRAYTIILAVTFTELAIGLWLMGYDYFLPVAAAIALLDILPLIGSGAILIPWGIILLGGGNYPGGIGMLLLFGVLAVVRNIVEPRVVGKQIGLHPIATITAMYAGLQIAGFLGLFTAPLLVLLIRYLCQNSNN